MIYSDAAAYQDTEDYPGNRGSEVCLNCGVHYGSHCGWACYKHFSISGKFSKLLASQRYLTQSMQDSFGVVGDIVIGSVEVVQPKALSYTCPCGIYRGGCDYHKPQAGEYILPEVKMEVKEQPIQIHHHHYHDPETDD